MGFARGSRPLSAQRATQRGYPDAYCTVLCGTFQPPERAPPGVQQLTGLVVRANTFLHGELSRTVGSFVRTLVDPTRRAIPARFGGLLAVLF